MAAASSAAGLTDTDILIDAALPVGASISQEAHQLMVSYSLGHGLQIPDALIAATALEHGLTLYTKNTRHFQMIPGLMMHRPY